MVNLDPKDVLGSTGMFLDQCEQIWQESKTLQFPNDYKSCQNIVVCAMGGSAYGGYVAQSLFKDTLKIPLTSNNDYHLPYFANSNTLAILSSYSGTTEEVLSSKEEAQKKGLKITGLTIGGELATFFQKNNIPGLIFDPKYNPSAQPRLGTGYIVLGTIALLNKLGVINVSDEEVEHAISEVRQSQEDIKSKAQNLAEKIQTFIPVIISAEFLSGNAHILRNQFNETAKSFATFSLLSELNHHLMEGLKNPPDKKLFVLFLSSDLYSDKLKKRVELTKDVIEKNGVGFDEYKVSGSSKLAQMLNVLLFGGYLTLYLAFLYGQDPSLIPWVDYFKEKLEKEA
ncbi:bifunctional phosphoglucose/phosphomannose isomerase [Candidatus Microgenomates bacterium]|nr:bifunctional phosphoglucose/phosphomannose isomerase [Candidatus Microgenomates bacterium]